MTHRTHTRLARPQPRRGGAATASPPVRLWRLFESGAWDEARALLHPGFSARWPQSDERFLGEHYLAVNRSHPAPGWRLEIHHVVEGQGCCALNLTLEHSEGVEHGACFYAVSRGLIVNATEVWAERTTPPAWRAGWNARAA